MKYLATAVITIIIYLGIGCAYQSTYDDLLLREIFTENTPISTYGHIFAWWIFMLFSVINYTGFPFLIIIVIAALAIFKAE